MIFALWAWFLALFVNTADTVPGPRLLYNTAKYKTFYIEQPLDHFSFAVKGTFRQRYLVLDSYWKGNGSPIFFYTGNEGDIVLFYNNTGLMFEWASEFNAMVVFAEHRYYGKSLPFGKDSFKGLERVGYLSSEQALADFVTLIDHIKSTTSGASRSPVVAFGGSYGGMLAAWLRMKYPHAVIGSLAASAPIWLFDHLVPCDDYSHIVTQDFNKSGANCVTNIQRSWKVINSMASTESGRATLGSVLKLCEPLKSPDDVRTLKGWLSETWINLAMVDYPYPASFLEPLPGWPIKAVCSHLSQPDLTDVKLLLQLHDAVNVYYNYTGTTPCFSTNQTSVGSLEVKGWDFQSCTEMVMPMCSDGISDMFESDPWNLTQLTAECRKKWNVVPRPRWIVEQYGGKNISTASNIIFSNGDLDPWSAGGVLESPSPSLVTIVIKDAAHHLDLRSSNPNDTADVIAARKKEKAVVRDWLQQYWNRPQSSTQQADDKSMRLIVVSQQNAYDDSTSYGYSREPLLRDEILVFVLMAAMFIGILVIVNFTRNIGRRRLYMTFDEMPLL